MISQSVSKSKFGHQKLKHSNFDYFDENESIHGFDRLYNCSRVVLVLLAFSCCLKQVGPLQLKQPIRARFGAKCFGNIIKSLNFHSRYYKTILQFSRFQYLYDINLYDFD